MKNPRMTFCFTCGQGLVPSEPPRYDGYTGEKINDRCPSGLCHHYGIAHEYTGGGFFRSGKCRKCGDEEPYYD